MNITETKRQQCQKTLYHYLKDHAAHTPDKVWLSNEREEVTFRDALGRVESAAMQFLACGMKKGDLLALRATRCIDTVLLAVAAASVGAIAALTDAHFPVQTYLRDTGVKMRRRTRASPRAEIGSSRAAARLSPLPSMRPAAARRSRRRPRRSGQRSPS